MIIYRIEKCDDNPVSRHECAHKLLSQMLSHYTHHSYSELKIKADGKPYIDSAVFSVSHSTDVAVVAMCVDKSNDDTPVADVNCDSIGVDIESISDKKKEMLLKVAQRKFFDSEVALLESCTDDEKYVETFCELWTKKESYCKLTGEGLVDALNFDTQKENEAVCFFSDIVTVNGKKYAISICYNSK